MTETVHTPVLPEGHPVWMTGPTARVFDGILRMYEWN